MLTQLILQIQHRTETIIAFNDLDIGNTLKQCKY